MAFFIDLLNDENLSQKIKFHTPFGVITNLSALSNAFEVGAYCIPSQFPENNPQKGPTCGVNALRMAINYSGYTVQRVLAYKSEVNSLDDKKTRVSIRQVAKRGGDSKFGEIFNVNSFKKIAEELNYPGTEVLDPREATEFTEKMYIKTICDALKTQHTIITSVDNDLGTPGKRQGAGCHWALLFGYIELGGQCYFLVSHREEYWLWSAHDLFESNLQLPAETTSYSKQSYYKYTENHIKLTNVNEQNKKPANILKEIPLEAVQELKQFRFGLFSCPVNEKHRPIFLNEKKVIKKYTHEEKNPSLAQRCHYYQRTDAYFNQCLAIDPALGDELPVITLYGKETSYPEYCFIKLPKTASSAFLLNSMIDQVRNQNSDLIKNNDKEALTSEKSGFYVLLKAKTPNDIGKNPIHSETNDIDETHYSVRGYVKAKLTDTDNLVFVDPDYRRKDQHAMIAFLSLFAKELFKSNPANNRFFRVLMSVDEQPPAINPMEAKKIKDSFSPIDYPEKFKIPCLSYLNYANQVVIDSNQIKIDELNDSLKKLFPHEKHEFNVHSLKQKEWLATIFLSSNQNYKELFKNDFNELWDLACKNPVYSELYFLLHQAGLLNVTNFNLIKKITSIQPNQVYLILDGLAYFLAIDPLFLTDDSLQYIVNSVWLTEIKNFYQMLRLVPEIDTPEHRNALRQFSFDKINPILCELSSLFQRCPMLLEPKHLTILKQFPLDCLLSIAKLLYLPEKPLSTFNLKMLQNHETQDIRNLILILSYLVEFDPRLITDDSFELLVDAITKVIDDDVLIKLMLSGFDPKHVNMARLLALLALIETTSLKVCTAVNDSASVFSNFFNEHSEKITDEVFNDLLATHVELLKNLLSKSIPIKEVPGFLEYYFNFSSFNFDDLQGEIKAIEAYINVCFILTHFCQTNLQNKWDVNDGLAFLANNPKCVKIIQRAYAADKTLITPELLNILATEDEQFDLFSDLCPIQQEVCDADTVKKRIKQAVEGHSMNAANKPS